MAAAQYADLCDLASVGLTQSALQKFLTFSQPIHVGTDTGTVVATCPTGAPNPLATLNLVVSIVASGGLGAGTFQWSTNGGLTSSGTITIPASGVYVIPGNGVQLAFAGHFTAAETYSTTILAGQITQALVTASSVVNSYLQPKFASLLVPDGQGNQALATWGADIRRATAKIAAWDLLSGGVGYNPQIGSDRVVREGYDDILGRPGQSGWLRMVAQGQIQPDGLVPGANPSTPNVATNQPTYPSTGNPTRGWVPGSGNGGFGSPGGGYGPW